MAGLLQARETVVPGLRTWFLLRHRRWSTERNGGVLQARETVVAWLKELGLFRGRAGNAMRLGLCSRSKDVIEPVLKPQWWVACAGMAADACAAARDGRLRIEPRENEATWFRCAFKHVHVGYCSTPVQKYVVVVGCDRPARVFKPAVNRRCLRACWGLFRQRFLACPSHQASAVVHLITGRGTCCAARAGGWRAFATGDNRA